jgi:hypothetical protein
MSYGTEGYGETPYGFIGTHSINIVETTVGVLDALTASGGSVATSSEPKPPKPPLPAPPVAGGPEQPPPQHIYRIVPLITRRGG